MPHLVGLFRSHSPGRWLSNWHLLWRLADIALPLATGWALVAFRGWRHQRLEAGAASWPTAYARVQAVLVEHDKRWTKASYRYYAASGTEAYFGEYRRHFRKPEQAANFALHLRGQEVLIRYNPQHPHKSVLVERELTLRGLV